MNIKVKEGKQEEDVFVLCRLDSGTMEIPKEGKWNHREDQATAPPYNKLVTGWNYCLDSPREDRHCKQPWPSPLQELKQTEPAARESINFQTYAFNCRESMNKGGGCTGENIPTQQNAKQRHTNRPGSTLAQRVSETRVPRVAEMNLNLDSLMQKKGERGDNEQIAGIPQESHMAPDAVDRDGKAPTSLFLSPMQLFGFSCL
eukprot:bmy_06101T0